MATFNIQTAIFIILPPNKIHKRVTNVLTFHIFSSFMLHNLLAYLYFNLPDSAPLYQTPVVLPVVTVRGHPHSFPSSACDVIRGRLDILLDAQLQPHSVSGRRSVEFSAVWSDLRAFKLSFREYFHRKFTDISLVHWGIWLKRQMSTAWKGTELQMGELRE